MTFTSRAPLPFSLSLSTITALLCLLGAIVTSLFFEGYADLTYAPAALLLYLAGALALIPAIKNGWRPPVSVPALLLYSFCFYIMVSVSWSSVPFASLITLIVFSSLPLAFFTTDALIRRPAMQDTLIASLILTLAALGFWALLQGTVLRDIYGARAHHPLPNANSLAALLNLGLLPALTFTLTSRRKASMAGLAVTLVLFSGLLATGSRGGFLFFLLAAAVSAFIVRKDIKQNQKHALLVIGSLTLLFIVFQIVAAVPLADRLSSLAAPLSDTNSLARLSLWKQGVRMFLDHGLTGTGLGTFFFYYPPYREALIDNSAGFWLHLDPLQYGIETGFAAVLLFYAALFATLIHTAKALKYLPPKTETTGSKHRIFVAGTFGALLTVAVHSHISFPLYIMPILIICGIWLAVLLHLTERPAPLPEPPVASKNAPYVGIGAFCLTLGLFAVITISSAMAQYHLLAATDSIRKGHLDPFLTHIEKAQTWGPASFIDPQVQLVSLHVDMLGDAAILFTPDEQEEIFNGSLALLQNAETLNPVWAEIDYKRGRLFAVKAQRGEKTKLIPPAERLSLKEQAIAAWRAGLEKNPQHHKTRFALANMLLQTGDAASAYDMLNKGLQFPASEQDHAHYQSLLKQIEGVATVQKAYRLRKSKQDAE